MADLRKNLDVRQIDDILRKKRGIRNKSYKPLMIAVVKRRVPSQKTSTGEGRVTTHDNVPRDFNFACNPAPNNADIVFNDVGPQISPFQLPTSK